MTLNIIVTLGTAILCIVSIIAVTIGLRSAKGKSDTAEFITQDGKRLTFQKWAAEKISSGTHPTYYIDENHNLNRRKEF
jgi:hypothetical protein